MTAVVPYHPPGALEVLSPIAGDAQLAPRVRVPLAVRVLLAVLALALTAGFLGVSIAGAVQALHDPSKLDTIGGDDASVIASYLSILFVSLIALAVSWGVNGIRAGGFPRGVRAAAGRVFTGYAALVYVPLVICTTVQVILTIVGAVPQSNGIQSSIPVGLVTSLGSGVSEEVFVVAVPIAVFDRFVRWRPARAPWWPAVLTVVVLAAARLSYHVYYGWTALVLLPWAVLSVVVYLRTRAVLPLMVLHVVYDAVLQLPGILGIFAVVVLMVVAIVLGALRVSRARARPPGGPPADPPAAGPGPQPWPDHGWQPAPAHASWSAAPISAPPAPVSPPGP